MKQKQNAIILEILNNNGAKSISSHIIEDNIAVAEKIMYKINRKNSIIIIEFWGISFVTL